MYFAIRTAILGILAATGLAAGWLLTSNEPEPVPLLVPYTGAVSTSFALLPALRADLPRPSLVIEGAQRVALADPPETLPDAEGVARIVLRAVEPTPAGSAPDTWLVVLRDGDVLRRHPVVVEDRRESATPNAPAAPAGPAACGGCSSCPNGRAALLTTGKPACDQGCADCPQAQAAVRTSGEGGAMPATPGQPSGLPAPCVLGETCPASQPAEPTVVECERPTPTE